MGRLGGQGRSGEFSNSSGAFLTNKRDVCHCGRTAIAVGGWLQPQPCEPYLPWASDPKTLPSVTLWILTSMGFCSHRLAVWDTVNPSLLWALKPACGQWDHQWCWMCCFAGTSVCPQGQVQHLSFLRGTPPPATTPNTSRELTPCHLTPWTSPGYSNVFKNENITQAKPKKFKAMNSQTQWKEKPFTLE